MTVGTINFKYIYLVLLMYLGIFWSWIQSKISFFTYWDEGMAFIFLCLLIVSILVTGKIKIKKNDLKLLIGTLVYCICGIIGNYLNGYVDWMVALKDIFINLKFLLILYFVIAVFCNTDIMKYRVKLTNHIKVITSYLFILLIIDKIFHVFPIYEVRFGISSEQFFWAHPSYTASAIAFLILTLFYFGDLKKISNFLCFIILILLEILTLRFKAIGVTICFCAIYIFFVVMKAKKLKIWIIGLIVVSILLICYDQVYFYFLSEQVQKMPRGAILYTSIEIAKDYFPFGTGFGTFGSYLSVSENYSPVYSMYHINTIYGMTADNFEAANDQYWPTILGQTGILGMSAQIYVFFILYKKICLLKNYNLSRYIAALGAFVYILVSSTSESAIVNPVTIPLAIIMGLCFSQKNL